MKILTTKEAISISEKQRALGKSIVLAGGCFDILHIGHISFLEKAKKEGDVLFVFLESDHSVKQRKGQDRPVNTQKDRAIVLAAISFVDYVILLPEKLTNNDYDKLVSTIKPAIIAATKGDRNNTHKERQAKQTGAQIVEVIDRIADASTTKLANALRKGNI